MFRIPSAAALGLCRLCGSVIGSIWKPTASPALPVGGSVRGSRTHGAFPAPRPACLKAHLSLGSRPTYITVFFCVNSFRNPPVSLFSPGSESMGTEHQGRIPALVSSWVSSLQEGEPICNSTAGESTLGAAAAGAGAPGHHLGGKGVARGVHSADKATCILIHALAATRQSCGLGQGLGDLFSSVKWDNKGPASHVVMNTMRVNTDKRLEPAWHIGGTAAVSGDSQDAYLAYGLPRSLLLF